MSPAEIRRRRAEAVAHHQSTTRVYHESGIELAAKLAQLRKQCPHENTETEAAQYCSATHCLDCGALLNLTGEPL